MSGAIDAPLTTAPRWITLRGRSVTVRAPEGSYAARRAAAELREAEAALAAIADLLAVPAAQRGEEVAVYLADAVADPAADAPAPGSEVGPDAILRVVQPDAPGEPLTAALTRFLVARSLCPPAPALFTAGIAGVVAARIGAGPLVAAADDAVRGRTAEDGSALLFASPPDPAAATSFVAFLLARHGPAALVRFLSTYEPHRPDDAARAVYGEPLRSLERAWLASLGAQRTAGAAFRALFRQLAPLLSRHWPRWLELLAYLVFGMVYTVALPLAFKFLIDDVILEGRLRVLAVFTLALLGLFVLNALVGMRRAYAATWINQRILLGLQEEMFERLQQLPHRFYARARVGDLMSRLSVDLERVREAMSLVLTRGFFLVFNAAAALAIAFWLSPLLGALVLVAVPLFGASYVALLSRVQAASREAQARFGNVQAEAQEALSAQAVIKAFGLERRTVASYRGRLLSLFESILRLVVLGSLFEASVAMAVALGQVLVLGVGGYLVIDGQVTLGTLVAFVGLMPTFFEPITTLATVGSTVQKAAGAMDRVLEVLEAPLEVADAPGAVELPRLEREIRLERVSFGYERGDPVLVDLDVTIPAGSHVAIVGPSGSGKTTVANLLLRFWDPDEGRVLFDGHDLRSVTLASLRGQIGIVLQDTFVFDTTVRENIALARPGASAAEIVTAAKAARLDRYVESLPEGYDTVLGERGVRMSGGQRQRLAIARALLRDPRVLVLDEATSALDPRTEREILEALAALARGRTTISITHRLSLAATANHILVLDDGRLVEQGTHAALARAGGLYQRLYEEQMRGFAEGPVRATPVFARLRAIPLFAGLGDPGLGAVAERLALERHAAGEDIVRQREEGDRLYLIASGQAEVLVGEDGGERRVNLLHEGDYFGELALVTGETRSATVRTTAPTELYSLARSDFLRLLEREPAVRASIDETIARRRAAVTEAAAAAARERARR